MNLAESMWEKYPATEELQQINLINKPGLKSSKWKFQEYYILWFTFTVIRGWLRDSGTCMIMVIAFEMKCVSCVLSFLSPLLWFRNVGICMLVGYFSHVLPLKVLNKWTITAVCMHTFWLQVYLYWPFSAEVKHCIMFYYRCSLLQTASLFFFSFVFSEWDGSELDASCYESWSIFRLPSDVLCKY